MRLQQLNFSIRAGVLVLAALCAHSLLAQENEYTAANVTGQLSLTRVVNLNAAPLTTEGAQRPPVKALEFPLLPSVFPHPPLKPGFSLGLQQPSAAQTAGLTVVPPIGFVSGFNGLSHYDQRKANAGNQFSVEPPNASIAVANGYILEGVNNAVQVFSQAGTAQLSQTVASNQLFGVAAAIDQNTGVNGVFPTDMRVFYDYGINRWFVLQRSQDNDTFGDPLATSHIYLAVSQTSSPTGAYNVYVMDTTDSNNLNCPCVLDFPQIGADQYGFYISANEYNISSPANPYFVDAAVLAISKKDLAGGASAPKSPATWMFILEENTGFEFSLQPVTAPQGASQFMANGGVEFLVSSNSQISEDNQLAIWALTNTASIQGANPSLLLVQATVPTLPYIYPGVAVQRPGPRTLGTSTSADAAPCPCPLSFIDGGEDSRVLSAAYAGGQIFLTLATEVTDQNNKSLVGGYYAIISPALTSNGFLTGAVAKQGYLIATGENILRPAVAVNSQGKGAIGFTLVGPDYFPSGAFVNFGVGAKNPTGIQIGKGGAGTSPEDGFSGYDSSASAGVARWGDYSTAAFSADGTIWLVSEYIPNGPRTEFANWGTFLSQYVP